MCVCVWRGLKISARPSAYSFTSVDWEADGRELDGRSECWAAIPILGGGFCLVFLALFTSLAVYLASWFIL